MTARVIPVGKTIAAVFSTDGYRRLGYTFHRGKQGFQACDRHDDSIGIFPTRDAAAAALAHHNNGEIS
jgi:hypothetical protein